MAPTCSSSLTLLTIRRTAVQKRSVKPLAKAFTCRCSVGGIEQYCGCGACVHWPVCGCCGHSAQWRSNIQPLLPLPCILGFVLSQVPPTACQGGHTASKGRHAQTGAATLQPLWTAHCAVHRRHSMQVCNTTVCSQSKVCDHAADCYRRCRRRCCCRPTQAHSTLVRACHLQSWA